MISRISSTEQAVRGGSKNTGFPPGVRVEWERGTGHMMNASHDFLSFTLKKSGDRGSRTKGKVESQEKFGEDYLFLKNVPPFALWQEETPIKTVYLIALREGTPVDSAPRFPQWTGEINSYTGRRHVDNPNGLPQLELKAFHQKIPSSFCCFFP